MHTVQEQVLGQEQQTLELGIWQLRSGRLSGASVIDQSQDHAEKTRWERYTLTQI